MSRIRDRKTDNGYFRLELKGHNNSKMRTYLKCLNKIVNSPSIRDEITKRTVNALVDEMLYGRQPR